MDCLRKEGNRYNQMASILYITPVWSHVRPQGVGQPSGFFMGEWGKKTRAPKIKYEYFTFGQAYFGRVSGNYLENDEIVNTTNLKN